MKRIWIPLNQLEVYDELHQLQPDGTFLVDETKDGETTQEHLDGINYIAQLLAEGVKVLPILALDNGDGTFTRLDGFKRVLAHFKNNYSIIEAFVVSKDEYDRAEFFPFRQFQMRAWHGGQDGENGKLPLLEGGEQQAWKYEDTKFLYNSPNADGLKIEVSECIHVHWGAAGKYRLAVGRRDFEELAKAVSSIWEK